MNSRSKKGRRNFIRKSGLAAAATALGTEIVFSENLFPHWTPARVYDPNEDLVKLFGKDKDLSILNDRPWNVETPPHLLDDAITPAARFFMRNNGMIPEPPEPENWVLRIDGEAVNEPLEISLEELKTKFDSHDYELVIECGGNGRAEFYPPASGNQWTSGAVACARWTGVRLRDVLRYAGMKDTAVYVAYYGIDRHLSGDPDKVVISRGIPLAKAMDEDVILAYKMNGEDIPLAHGFPLRLVAGGWPGSASGKWVNRISIRDRVHDGPKMMGDSYRVPCDPVPPGANVDEENMCIIEAMPVKSLITFPRSGAIIQRSRILEIRGQAWSGDRSVQTVSYSIDFGATWNSCTVKSPSNRNAWQRFTAEIPFPKKGYYEIWARATDSEGISQPMLVPGWNPKGYLNNACHRIAVKVV